MNWRSARESGASHQQSFRSTFAPASSRSLTTSTSASQRRKERSRGERSAYAGRISYYGVITSDDKQYENLIKVLKNEKLDFVQMDYSIANRNAEERILPLAKDKGVATPRHRQVKHLADNAGAARGVLPDAALRKRVEEAFASL